MKFIRHNILFIVVFLIFLCKTAFWGYSYYPVLDDYIQYISYHFYVNKWDDIIIAGGFYGMRPLAAVFDVYIWSNFHNNLNLLYFILCMIHFASYLLFMKAFKTAEIKAGIFFTAFYLFLPVTVEAVYWLSASTRIIVPLFFCALSLYFMQKKDSISIITAWVLNIISFCFYEQIIIVSFILSIYVLNKRNRKFLFIPAINALIIGFWYIIFSGAGVNSGRSGIGFDFNKIISIFGYLKEMWFNMLPRFFLTGIRDVCLYGYIIIVILFILCLSVAYNFKKEKNYLIKADILLPVLLFVLPYTPFMILTQSWPGLRNVMPSVMALGLACDLIQISVIKKYVPPLIIFFSVFSYYTSVNNYKQVYDTDQKILNIIIDNNIPGKINAESSYNNIFPQYGEYIKNLTSSGWAVTGGVRAKTENVKIPILKIEEDGFNVNILLK